MSSSRTPPFAGSQPLRAQRSASSAGDGSYTPVFIVLGVIAALLVISCFVGQVCTKKHLRPRPRRDRVAYYDDDMLGGMGHGPHGGPYAIPKMEATSSASVSVETRPTGDATVAVHQTAA